MPRYGNMSGDEDPPGPGPGLPGALQDRDEGPPSGPTSTASSASASLPARGPPEGASDPSTVSERPAGRSTASGGPRARSVDRAAGADQSTSSSASPDDRSSERGRQPGLHADGQAVNTGNVVGLPPGLGARRTPPSASGGAEGRDPPSQGLMRAGDGTLPPVRADADVGGLGAPPGRLAPPAAGAALPPMGVADRGQRSSSVAATFGASSSSPQSPTGTPEGDAEMRRLAPNPSAPATASGGAQCELPGGGGLFPPLKTSGAERGVVALSPLPTASKARSESEDAASTGLSGPAGPARKSGTEGAARMEPHRYHSTATAPEPVTSHGGLPASEAYWTEPAAVLPERASAVGEPVRAAPREGWPRGRLPLGAAQGQERSPDFEVAHALPRLHAQEARLEARLAEADGEEREARIVVELTLDALRHQAVAEGQAVSSNGLAP